MLYVCRKNLIVLTCNLFVPFRVYFNPKPSQESISSAVDALHASVLENLSSKSVSATIIPFRHDVFIIFSRGRVQKAKSLEKQDFSRCTFPSNDCDKLLDTVA